MKRTGIKATDAEIERLKSAASAPVMMVGGFTPPDPAKLAHEIALEHGLPEIPGFYGIDLATGEFLTADNAPLPEGLADRVTPSVRERVERVLGKGIHPAAIDRLLALWPDAYVKVEHSKSKYPGIPRHTRVLLARENKAGEPWVDAFAHCNPLDQFNRRTGTRLAFNRALKLVKEVTEGAPAKKLAPIEGACS